MSLDGNDGRPMIHAENIDNGEKYEGHLQELTKDYAQLGKFKSNEVVIELEANREHQDLALIA